jgi:Raf kinase inhibitor-like YbhB/YbcL family protein
MVAGFLTLPGTIAPGNAADPSAKVGTLDVSSPAFVPEGMIPAKYTCEGGNVSPPLVWSTVPAGTRTVALICDDPDAPGGSWVHWVLFDLPASVSSLAEKVEATGNLPNDVRQGANDFGKLGYGGPCPPPGKAHHYFFKVYALDIKVPLRPGVKKADLLQAMEHHILAEGVLMAKFQRKR